MPRDMRDPMRANVGFADVSLITTIFTTLTCLPLAFGPQRPRDGKEIAVNVASFDRHMKLIF